MKTPEMKTIYVDVELAGQMGKRRLVTKSLDGLYDLRQACRDAVAATPKEEWCDGMTADQIVDKLVGLCLNPKQPLTAEVYSYTMGRKTIEVILRLPRATILGITRETIEILEAVGNPKPVWTSTV